jgi:putative transposase
MLRERFGVSQRRACRVVGQNRSTQRKTPLAPGEDEQRLREFLRAFSRQRPRWGWRRAAQAARRAGWRVNDKRIQRLWREEGLKVPYRRRKKRLACRPPDWWAGRTSSGTRTNTPKRTAAPARSVKTRPIAP